MGPKSHQIWCYIRVSFLNHIASILYERGLMCGAVYPLSSRLQMLCSLVNRIFRKESSMVLLAYNFLYLLERVTGQMPGVREVGSDLAKQADT